MNGPSGTIAENNPVLAAFNAGVESKASPRLSLEDIDRATDRHPNDAMLLVLAQALGELYALAEHANNPRRIVAILDALALLVQHRKYESLDEKKTAAQAIFQKTYQVSIGAGKYGLAAEAAANAAAALLRKRVPNRIETRRAEGWLNKARVAQKKVYRPQQKDSALLAAIEGFIRLAKTHSSKPTVKQLSEVIALFETAYNGVRLTDPAMMATLLCRHADSQLMLFHLLEEQAVIEASKQVVPRLPLDAQEVLAELDYTPSQILTSIHESPWVLGIPHGSIQVLTRAEIQESILNKLRRSMEVVAQRALGNEASFSGAQTATAIAECILAEHQWLLAGTPVAFDKYVEAFARKIKSQHLAREALDEALSILDQGYQRGINPPVEFSEILQLVVDFATAEHEMRKVVCSVIRAGGHDEGMNLLGSSPIAPRYQAAHILHDPYGTIVVLEHLGQQRRVFEIPIPGGFVVSVLNSSVSGRMGLNAVAGAGTKATKAAIALIMAAQAPIIDALLANLIRGVSVLLYVYGQYQQFPIQPALEEAAPRFFPEIITVLDKKATRSSVNTSGIASVLVAADTGPQTLVASEVEESIVPSLLSRIAHIEVDEVKIATRCSSLAFENALERGGIIHYTGHSTAFPLDQPSVILYDEHLKSDIIGRIDAHSVSLIMLNSCESGKQPLNPLDPGLVGLATSLIRAGCGNVISSYWPVLDLPSFYFAVEFYNYLAENGFSQEVIYAALAHTQEWLRKATRGQIEQRYSGIISLHPEVRPPSVAVDQRPFSDPWCWASFFLSAPAPQ